MYIGIFAAGVYTAVWSVEQSYALSMFFLKLHSHGYDLGLLFFGLSNLILGYLVIQAHGFPAIFGYALIGAVLVYLLGGVMRFLFPAYLSFVQPLYLVPLMAELGFALWLLIKGVKRHT